MPNEPNPLSDRIHIEELEISAHVGVPEKERSTSAAINCQHFFLAISRPTGCGRSNRQHSQLFDRCGGNEEFCTRSIDKSDRDTRRPAGNALAENFPHSEDHGGAAKISSGGRQARLGNRNADCIRRLKAIPYAKV